MDTKKKVAFVDLLVEVLLDSNFKGVDVKTLQSNMVKFMDNEASINEMKTDVKQHEKTIAEKEQTIARNETRLKIGADAISKHIEEIRTLSASLTKLRRDNDTLHKANGDLENEKNDLDAKNKELRNKTQSLAVAIEAEKKINEKLETKIKTLEARSQNTGVDDLKKKIEELKRQKRKDVNELQSAYRHPQMNTSTFSSFFF